MIKQYARSFVALLIGAFGLFSVSSSFAQTASDPFLVTAEVEAACQIDATDYDFGTYNPILGTILSTNLATVTVTCNLLTPYSVGINDGGNSSGPGNRNMLNTDGSLTANNTLNYNMACLLPSLPIGLPLGIDLTDFDLTGCTPTWGAIGSGNEFVGLGLGPIPLPITLAGTIPAGQNVAVGTYEDTLTATVSY